VYADLLCTTGAVPLLVLIARESSHRPVNRELSAALLAVLCRSQDVQVDVVAAGGIPALARCAVLHILASYVEICLCKSGEITCRPLAILHGMLCL
jgi:hypothetical protein